MPTNCANGSGSISSAATGVDAKCVSLTLEGCDAQLLVVMIDALGHYNVSCSGKDAARILHPSGRSMRAQLGRREPGTAQERSEAVGTTDTPVTVLVARRL